jgi:hypothetical protein
VPSRKRCWRTASAHTSCAQPQHRFAACVACCWERMGGTRSTTNPRTATLPQQSRQGLATADFSAATQQRGDAEGPGRRELNVAYLGADRPDQPRSAQKKTPAVSTGVFFGCSSIFAPLHGDGDRQNVHLRNLSGDLQPTWPQPVLGPTVRPTRTRALEACSNGVGTAPLPSPWVTAILLHCVPAPFTSRILVLESPLFKRNYS